MYLEFRHLRTIRAIHQAGGLARAADMLNMTQSALSHQVKGLEDQAGMELFVRRSKPMKLSAAGLRMLRLAERIEGGGGQRFAVQAVQVVQPQLDLGAQALAGLRLRIGHGGAFAHPDGVGRLARTRSADARGTD